MYRRPICRENASFQFLRSASSFLGDLKFVNSVGKDVGKTIYCIEGWQLTISAILGLSEDLMKHGFKYVCTRRLNQDSLEHFYGLLRRSGGLNDKPTASQFSCPLQASNV